MGYPAAMGRGPSRTDATRVRDLAPTTFQRRNPPELRGARLSSVPGLAQQGWALVFLCAPWRFGGHGRQGRAAGSQKYGAVCADRLAKE
jgi:hypothetical protein